MDVDSWIRMIESRRSVRTFDGKSIDDKRMKQMKEYIEGVSNPFKVDVLLKMFDAEKYSLSSPVIIGEPSYIMGLVPSVHFAEIAYGYTLEKVVLFAKSIGLGTVWLGGTFNRDHFHDAVGIRENEIMPCVMPVGVPANKMSIREILMRKGAGSDSRNKFSKMFFNGNFDVPLTEDAAEKFLNPLKMVRLAPSAMNKQPWRVVVKGKYVHFYKKADKGFNKSYGDIQKVDMGIALCHFDLTAKEEGIKGEFIVKVPGITVQNDIEYIISYVMEN